MTIETYKLLPKSLRGVKNMSAAILMTVAMGTLAQASSNTLIDREVSVEIAVADLADPKGIEKTYAKLEKEAKGFCKSESESLRYFGETLKECVADLMDQFVTSANIKPLKAYHEAKADRPKVRQLAMK